MRSFIECIPCTEREYKRREPISADLTDVPGHLLSAVVTAFHADHEGHALRLVIDGRQIYPTKNKQEK